MPSRHGTHPVVLEPIERRGEARGVFAELTLALDPPHQAVVRPEHASWRSFFIPGVDLPLAALVRARIRVGGDEIVCRLRVVRVDEDGGAALRVVELSPAGEKRLRQLLGAVSDDPA
jgi:hypothetical protein